LKLLELVALGAGVETEPGIRGEATRGGIDGVPARREGGAIAASAEARTGIGISSTSLAHRAEETRFAGRVWPASHGGVDVTRDWGYSSLAAPVKT
jgi:hypothetical protein